MDGHRQAPVHTVFRTFARPPFEGIPPMPISVFDLFTIGIGPSSSHTVGPMRAAKSFVDSLAARQLIPITAEVFCELFGSLGATGKGHGSDKAILLGLEGETPEGVAVEDIASRLAAIRGEHRLNLAGRHTLRFAEKEHLLFHHNKSLPGHSNALRFRAIAGDGRELASQLYYSIGGGFVLTDEEMQAGRNAAGRAAPPHPFTTAQELLLHCQQLGCNISDLMLANECAWRPEAEIRSRLMQIWQAMQQCVQRGIATEGELPGGLHVRRRAPGMLQALAKKGERAITDPLTVLDWICLYAIAVNEENAAGGRVVTAPTNGAAGILPAVLHYYDRFSPRPTPDGIQRFLLTAAAICILYKERASISGAEVGCQGEVGVACSMAAGALTEALGGTIFQVENAAEIGMEHNLGLTCDPIGGLVQIPCIERNAMGAIEAVNASRLALSGDGRHFVSLDKVIATMRETGHDMKSKYKETSRGGLAVNVVEC